MRTALVLAPALALASCGTYAPDLNSQRSEAQLAAELGMRVAGAPASCIPNHPTTEMRSYGRAITFRNGNDLYVNRTQGGCENAGMSGNTFVIDNRGSAGNLCRNTTVRVVTSSNGMYAGSCSRGDFVPYRLPR